MTFHLSCFAQDSHIKFLYEIKTNNLGFLKDKYGEDSDYYLDALIEKSFEVSDTTFHDYFKESVIRLSESVPIIKTKYGLDSNNYRIVCSAFNWFLLGKFFDTQIFPEYEGIIYDNLLPLEKELSKVKNNKSDFAAILTNLYQVYLPDFSKALKYAKIYLKETEVKHTENPTEYYYAFRNYCRILGHEGNYKELIKFLDTTLVEFDEKMSVDMLTDVADAFQPTELIPEITNYIIKKVKDLGGKYEDFICFPSTIAVCGDTQNVILFEETFLNDVAIEKKIKFHLDMGMFLHQNSNDLIEARNQYIKGIQLAEENERYDILLNDGHTNSYESLSLIDEKLKDYDSVIKDHIKALKLIEKYYGTSSPEYYSQATYVSCLYDIYPHDVKKALEYYELGVTHQVELNINDYLYLIAHNYENGNFDKALDWVGKALKEFKEKPGLCSKIYNQLSKMEGERGDYEAALKYIDLAIDLSESSEDTSYFTNKASILRNLGYNDLAISLLQSILNERKIYNIEPKNLFDIYEQLGMTSEIPEDKVKYYSEAEKYVDTRSPFIQVYFYRNFATAYDDHSPQSRIKIDKAIDIYRENNLDDPILLGILYSALASYYSYTLNYEIANDYYLKALNNLKSLPIYNQTFLTCLNNAIVNSNKLQNYELCCELAEIVLNARKESLSSNHPDLLLSYTNYVSYLLEVGRYDDASDYLKEYEGLIEKIPNNSKYLTNLNLLNAQLAYLQNNFKEAEDIYIELLETTNDSQDLQNIYLQLVSIDYKSEVPIRTDYVKEYITLEREDIMRQMSYISSIDRSGWMNSVNISQNWLMILLDREPDLVETALDYNLLRKGLLFHTEKEISRLLRKNKKAKSDYEEIKRLQEIRNSVINSGDSVTLANLNNQISGKERELNLNFLELNNLKKSLNKNYLEFISKQDKNNLFVDFIRYVDHSGISRYGAFLLSKNLKPIFIDLYKEDVLINAVFNDPENFNIRYAFYRDTDKKKYKLIWEKLLPYFEGYSNIYFSPDGLLNKIAIEYLRDSEEVFVYEKHNLHRVFHIFDFKESPDKSRSFLGIGVGNHDAPIRSNEERGDWSDLNKVTEEMENISVILKKSTKADRINLFIDDSAREVSFKNFDFNNLSTIHFATHSFFMDTVDLEKAMNNPNSTEYYMAQRAMASGLNSLSGIVFRKGNEYRKLKDIPEDEDDILYSHEIESLDLSDISLIVMSSCQSGLGKVDSEGVWGLQRAFRIAGASSLICTLDYVNDDDAMKFMTEFYSNYSQGNTIYEAFTQAQKILYNCHKKSPARWAKFILIE